SDNIKQSLFDMGYDSEDFAETMFLNMFMIINACMSLITMIAAIFLIRHKITNDIEDQMQQIGVLEALGYKSSDISLSYVCEYLMTVGAGTLLGAIGAVAFTPVMNMLIRGMMNRNVQGTVNIGMVVLLSLVLIVVIMLFALDKARRVKAYPPVTALRKGISTHNFTRIVLPLSKTFKSVNARLAMKGLFRNLRQNIGAGLCITLASLSFLFSIYAFDTFKDGYDSLYRIMGIEICDDSVTLLPGVDAYGFRDEVEALPEVRKALVSYSWKYLSIQGSDNPGMVSIFDDYKDCENLYLTEGRFPAHDNEIAISLKRKNMEGLNIGDSLIAEGNGMQKSYVVTGVLGAMSNSGMNLYLTREGYERMYPDSRPDTVMVYLNEGVDRTAFEKKLSSIYGASAVETQENKEAAGTLEDRIKRAADEKMALLVANYGVTDIDYAIKVGDQMITGSSSGMIIKDVNSIEDLAKTQMGAIAGYSQGFTLGGMIFVSVVIVIILWIIVSSNVRRRRKDLGIMKSMGYSSKDLMKQIAIEFLPTTIVAVIIAAVASIYLQKSFWLLVFGADIGINFLLLSLCSIGIVLFCYVVTYICAGRIKKISVNELMTE
ncbi:MAG: ABC transporter permease, partial [Clostridiales bacterium]|nr:ABC transporter permease [Clostridiales bacterium]